MGELKLIGENGRPNFGIYDRPVNNINLQDLKPYGKNRYSGLERKYIYTFKIKKWEYIGLTDSNIVFGSAIVSTGYLGNVTFNYNDTNVMDMWQIFSTDNKVYLTFTPEGIRKADINAIFIKSKFYQPFGRFSGNITIGERKIALKEVYGFVEEYYAKW
jgi:hypothetical protein